MFLCNSDKFFPFLYAGSVRPTQRLRGSEWVWGSQNEERNKNRNKSLLFKIVYKKDDWLQWNNCECDGVVLSWGWWRLAGLGGLYQEIARWWKRGMKNKTLTKYRNMNICCNFMQFHSDDMHLSWALALLLPPIPQFAVFGFGCNKPEEVKTRMYVHFLAFLFSAFMIFFAFLILSCS